MRDAMREEHKSQQGEPMREAFEVSAFHRDLMVEQIGAMLQKSRPNAPPAIVQRIPALARRIEATLFQSARTLAEYANRFTLEERMLALKSFSAAARSKRQRQTPKNSSCDLVKLHNDHRKRAMLNRCDLDANSLANSLRALGERHCVVARVSVGGERKIAFNFSRDKACGAASPGRGSGDARPAAPGEARDPEDLSGASSCGSSCGSSSDGEEEEGEEGDDGVACEPMATEGTSSLDSLDSLHGLYGCTVRLLQADRSSVEQAGAELAARAANIAAEPGRRHALAQALAFAMLESVQGDYSAWSLEDAVDVPAPKSEAAVAAALRDPASEESGSRGGSGLRPVSHVVRAASEHFARAPVDLRLVSALLCLLEHHGLEQEASAADKKVLTQAVDRFALADPRNVAPLVVRRLLGRWPTSVSERQVVFLSQIESVLRCSDSQTVRLLYPAVMARVARVARSDNWYVANTAMTLGDKLLGFARPFLRQDAEVARVASLFVDSLFTCAKGHWHATVRSRAAALGQSSRKAFLS